MSKPIELLPAAAALTGAEKLHIIQGANSRQTTIAALLALLVDSSPGALDTLNELAAALGDDANFAATVTTALAGKQPLDADLTAIAALATTPVGRTVLTYADAISLARALGLAKMLFSSGAQSDSAADTTEQTLKTYTLPANTCTVNGDIIRVFSSGVLAANTRNRAIKTYTGATNVSTNTVTAAHIRWQMKIEHIRVSAATKMTRWCIHLGNGSATDAFVVTGSGSADAFDWTIANDIKVTGQTSVGAAAGDTNCNSLSVEYVPYVA